MNDLVPPSAVGFVGVLTTAFICLKLMGVIDWRWVWVLSPVWISLIFLFFLIALVVMTMGRPN